MTWILLWSEPAVADLAYLNAKQADRVRAVVRRFADTGHGDVKKLKGIQAEYRLRVGALRVRFTIDGKARTLTVLRVLPRSEAYRD